MTMNDFPVTTRKATPEELAELKERAARKETPSVEIGWDDETPEQKNDGEYHTIRTTNLYGQKRATISYKDKLYITDANRDYVSPQRSRVLVDGPEIPEDAVIELIPEGELDGQKGITVGAAGYTWTRPVLERARRLGDDFARKVLAKDLAWRHGSEDGLHNDRQLKTFGPWHTAPLDSRFLPSGESNVGAPVGEEIEWLVSEIQQGRGGTLAQSRLATLLIEVAADSVSLSGYENRSEAVQYSMIEAWARITGQSRNTWRVDPTTRALRTLVGDAQKQVEMEIETGSTTQFDKFAVAAVKRAASALKRENNERDFNRTGRANSYEPTLGAIAERTAKDTRPKNKKRAAAVSIETFVAVARGEHDHPELLQFVDLVADDVELEFRFTDAVRMARTPEEAETTRESMYLALAKAAHEEYARHGQASGVSCELAYQIAQAMHGKRLDTSPTADKAPGKPVPGQSGGDQALTGMAPGWQVNVATAGVRKIGEASNMERYAVLYTAIGMLKKERWQDLAWDHYGEDYVTYEQIAERYGISRQAAHKQTQEVIGRVVENLNAIERGEVEIGKFGQTQSGAQMIQNWLSEIPTEGDERDRAEVRLWATYDRFSMYFVDRTDAFEGDLSEAYNQLFAGALSVREFVGWLQAQGKEAWLYTSAVQMHGRLLRRAVSRKQFENWFNRLPALNR